MGDKRVIHLVDDEEAIRKSAGFMLRMSGFAVHSYASGTDFLEMVDEAVTGCVILDLHMPDIDGLQVQKALAKRKIVMPVVILTASGDIARAVQAMRAGAVDFLAKPIEKAVLMAAIDRAFAQLENTAARAAEQAVALSKIAALTRREQTVLEGLADGSPNKIIAYKLGVSSRTVEILRAGLMLKLGARTLSDVLRIAFAAELGNRQKRLPIKE
ncbi:response regulator transcription factor [Sphingobium scionense]|jgi:two-component system response regulator FixJ|uniref:Response regulator n=2 Tax=Sphingobium TaxID=165695 RepID=A0A6P1GE08_SPHYA|nr:MULTISPECIES: response regulator [Sphingobium]MBB4147284.1 two-component system response regulator FixJ [Sphingobium scionense]QHD66639.1 response regulator [Sphingobium yanoikuyae]